MKIREDYEYSGWRRFVHWVNGDPKEDYIPAKDLRPTKVLSDDERENQKSIVKSNIIKKLSRYSSRHLLDWYQKFYRVFAVIVAFVMISILLITVSYLPEFGDANNAVNNEVAQRYIENGMQETGAVNIVAGVILDYRAFDTLGEAHVLFVAAICVLILLRLEYGKDGEILQSSGLKDEGYDRQFEPKNDLILKVITIILFPLMVLFGIYVILNGHISAGGGFAGGAIIGSALILYNNAYGFKKTREFFTYNTFKWVSLCSLLTYASLKTYSFFMGANHLDSGIPLGNPGDIISAGLILPLNICVGLVVAVTMYTFFAMFRKGGL